MGESLTLQQLAPQGFSRIEQLPDHLLVLILSFLPTLAEIARLSILSWRWRNIWHGVTCLDFDATLLLPVHKARASRFRYIAWVNKVLEARSVFPDMPPVKKLRIWFELEASHGCHIDRWISFAIANRVETLHLDFTPYFGGNCAEILYNLSEESWYKAPSGLSSLRCLKSLFLGSAKVKKQFIEFILSNCPLLEDLSLHYAEAYSELNVVGAPLRLRRLKLIAVIQYALSILCAPHLTSFYYKSREFNPQKIDVPNLNDLAIGAFRRYRFQPIMEYLKPFWSYLPQLEKLELIMLVDKEFRLNPIRELVKLKCLKICVSWDTNPFVDQILNFIEACPMLETFAFQISGAYTPKPQPLPRRRRKQKQSIIGERSCCFSCLKVLQLFGGGDKTITQDIVKLIINKSPHLEKLFVNVQWPIECPQLLSALPKQQPDVVEVVKAEATKLCKGRLSEVEIVVFG